MSNKAINPEDYRHSPVHYAVVLADHITLTKLLNSLPKLADPTHVHTESDSATQEAIASRISSLLDRRDTPHRETPLHLSVRLNDAFAAASLASAGADISLQNEAGWNPLQEALCRKNSHITSILVKHHHSAAWGKYRRRLPFLLSALRKMRDFYLEINFHFESSVIPFIDKMAPSDTYKITKREGNLRADTTLSGYDGLKIQRANQTFLFLGDGHHKLDIPNGSLIILNHDDGKIFDAFENAGAELSESDVAGYCNQNSVYRPGMDVRKAELITRTNWRRKEVMENVGEWKCKVYDVNGVVFSFRSRKIARSVTNEMDSVMPLEFVDEEEEGFLVAENPRFSCGVEESNWGRRRHSSFVREERDVVSVTRKSVDIIPERRRVVPVAVAVAPAPVMKEKEFVKSLKPAVWLTEGFPLKTEELLPLLDILANKVKAVRRMRELLTTKFPPGTFPVKIAIPVLPTVRVVITFTKFVELSPIEEFYTPLSSPRQFSNAQVYEEEEAGRVSTSSGLSWGWVPRGSKSSGSTSKEQGSREDTVDPFAIPAGYSWSSFDEKSKKVKKSKSTRKTK